MRALTNCLAAIALLGGVARLDAQGYSIQGTFDTSRVVILNGIITKIRLGGGALTYLFLDVKEANGSAVPWMLRLSAPRLLISRGFTQDSFRIGSRITAEVWAEKHPPTLPLAEQNASGLVPLGTRFGAAWKLTFDDGKVLNEASRPIAPWPLEPEIFPSQR
jgi:Family of unknown function (DUF6152)